MANSPSPSDQAQETKGPHLPQLRISFSLFCFLPFFLTQKLMNSVSSKTQVKSELSETKSVIPTITGPTMKVDHIWNVSSLLGKRSWG